jgi:hypothetical protein
VSHPAPTPRPTHALFTSSHAVNAGAGREVLDVRRSRIGRMRGVDLEADVDAVTSPLLNLRDRNANVDPERHCGAAELVLLHSGERYCAGVGAFPSISTLSPVAAMASATSWLRQ